MMWAGTHSVLFIYLIPHSLVFCDWQALCRGPTENTLQSKNNDELTLKAASSGPAWTVEPTGVIKRALFLSAYEYTHSNMVKKHSNHYHNAWITGTRESRCQTLESVNSPVIEICLHFSPSLSSLLFPTLFILYRYIYSWIHVCDENLCGLRGKKQT